MSGARRVPGIAPKGPAASLLTAARPLPDGTDWKSGIGFRESHVFASGAWAECPTGSKATPCDCAAAYFYPFTEYVAIQADWVTRLQAEEEGGFDPEAQAEVDAASAWYLSRELWTGATNVGNHFATPGLQRPFPGATDEFDPTHILNAGGALNPVDAIGQLLEAYADGTKMGGAVLHVPLRLATRLIADYTFVLDGNMLALRGLALVSPGPGYPGAGNTGPRTQAHSSGASAAAGQEWVYVTSPVEYAMGPVMMEPEDPDSRWWDPRTNQYYVNAERRMIFRFDPHAVWAALVTVPTAS